MTMQHLFTITNIPRQYDIDVAENIIKRREYLTYNGALGTTAANLAYITTPEVSVANNLYISDRSSSLPANRIYQSNYIVFDGIYFTTETDLFEVTDIFLAESETISEIPLFKKHTLLHYDPDTDTLLGYQLLDVEWKPIAITELLMDSSIGDLYHNLSPAYYSSLDYKAYYLRYAVKDQFGEIRVYLELLSSTPVYTQATDEDLDDYNQIIQDGRKVFFQVDELGVFTNTLPISNTYAYKILAKSKLSLISPSVATIGDPWFVRVTNGKVYTSVNGTGYKYSISVNEFISQSFSSYGAPIKYVENELSTIVTRNLIKLDNQQIYRDATEGVSILVNNYANEGIAAFTTNLDLVGTTAVNGMTYQIWTYGNRTGIRSIDYTNGLIDLEGIQLESTNLVFATYYYEATHYEFTQVNFNPINNRSIMQMTVSIFNDPDLTSSGEEKDQKLYYIAYNKAGRVVLSNHPLFDNDEQTWDGSTMYYEKIPEGVVGAKNFLSEYTVEGTNAYNFLVLGDVYVAESGNINEITWIDSRKRGGGISDLYIEQALETDPNVLYVMDQSAWDGIPYVSTASFLVEIPINRIHGADGIFSTSEVQSIVERHTALGVLPVIKAYGVDITVSGIEPSSNSITLYWNGHGY